MPQPARIPSAINALTREREAFMVFPSRLGTFDGT